MRRLSFIIALWCFANVNGLANLIASQQKEQSKVPEYEARVNAPDFPTELEWLNTERPLSLKALRGKIVLLDFWTYCCINCMHIIPDLKKLENKYEKELVVIGVHSAKFTGERDIDNIRQAILRYEIEHPVVNDFAMEVWQQYTVRAWPTLMLIDPDGKVVGYASGENIYDPFDKAIAKLIDEFGTKGKLDRAPLNLKLEKSKAPTSMLAFPGKVLADERSRQLFIADSNHNRLVVASLDDYAIKEVIGAGSMGLTDGDFQTAEFNHPQGMAFDGRVLYVADTENHAIRKVDFERRTVMTIAGTGKQSRRIDLMGGIGTTVALNSPWDLTLVNGLLYIAMAGPHQLWVLNPKTNGAVPFAGSGREDIIDGLLNEAALAQPSGLTTDGKRLYFADSEVSAVRAADLDLKGRVETIVGEGLFDYGDQDGRGKNVRLQHPLGIAYHNGVLYVADTYNNKIKMVSPADKSSTTFLGTGKEGLEDGAKATFDEPGGVSLAFGKLYIADTNNHAIRVADLKSRKVTTVQFKNLEKLRPPSAKPNKFSGEIIEQPMQTVDVGEANLIIQLELPAGYKLNPQAPSSVAISSSSSAVVEVNGAPEKTFRNPHFPMRVPLKVSDGETLIRVHLVVYYCEAARESLCYFKELRLQIPVKAQKGAGNRVITTTAAIKF
ncbi:MAG: thioredoxin-like domain-containing protein [Acidobacteriota bacterium]